MNRLEELLIKIINKEPIGDWGCENRLEQYLFCIVAKGTPEAEAEYANIRSIDHKVEINGLEAYLDLIYQMTANDTSGIIGEIIAARLEQISPESTPEMVEIINGRLEQISPESTPEIIELMNARLEEIEEEN